MITKSKQPTIAGLLKRETMQVIAQPHRLGYDGDMADPLGIFVRAHQCGRECYEAGNEYFRVVYRWRVANAIPVPLRLKEGESEEAGPREKETTAELEERIRAENQERLVKIKKCEEIMKCSGLAAFHGAQKLVLDGIYPERKIAEPVKSALLNLAIKLGFLRPGGG